MACFFKLSLMFTLKVTYRCTLLVVPNFSIEDPWEAVSVKPACKLSVSSLSWLFDTGRGNKACFIELLD